MTVATFQFNDLPGDAYVNSVWYPDNYQSYLGDVINVFNDGKIGDEGRFWPFNELESSSNAKAFKIGESQYYFHNTYHFQSDKKELNSITQRLFGVSLHEITQVFL